MFMNMDDGLIKAVQLWPRLGIVVVGIKQGRRISGNNIGKKYDQGIGVCAQFSNEVSRSVAVLVSRGQCNVTKRTCIN